ncbi:MAG: DUF1257 domain-containing protein [Planctomycetes bacterium]|nr:DUF1257 domain-containing protein [Planctomycetota bacterium]
MSAIAVFPVMLPAASLAWPLVATAAAAAASAMGFAAAKTKEKVDADTEVELSVENSEAITNNLQAGEELVFTKEDVEVVFSRNHAGKINIKVHGKNKTKEELEAIGKQLSSGLTQQYAYNQIVTELKKRNLNMVDEEIEADGTVRLQVRAFKD